MLGAIQVDRDSSVFIGLLMTYRDSKKPDKRLKYKEQNHTVNANYISLFFPFFIPYDSPSLTIKLDRRISVS